MRDLAFLGNPLSDWLLAGGAALGITLVFYLIRRVLLVRLERLSALTETAADDFVVALLRGTRLTVVVYLALAAALSLLELPHMTVLILRRLAVVALALQALTWGNAAVTFWIAQWAERNPQDSDRTTVRAFGYGAKAIVAVIVLLFALHNLGVNITTVVASLGVGGIAIALAVQNILGDLFGALSIVLDKPFVVGDLIAVDQFEGTIEHIGLKTTRVRSIDGEQVIFSNADLLRSRVRNLARRETRRYLLRTVVAVETSAAQLARVPEAFAAAVARDTRLTLQRSHLVASTPFGHEFETAFVVESADFDLAIAARQAVLLDALAALEADGIRLAAAPAALTRSSS